MIDQKSLCDLTESYIKGLVAETSGFLSPNFDSLTPFRELDIDSFRVLKILKKLEEDFGILPKSLLFEYFNIHDLARYFLDKHEAALLVRFDKDLRNGRSLAPNSYEAPARPVAPPPDGGPVRHSAIRIREEKAFKHPELGETVRGLFERYKIEGCVSRGTRKIAPYLFIGSARLGYFNYARNRNLILVYSYTGPRDYLPELVGEICQYCNIRSFELTILCDEELPATDGTSFSATPFGVLQRIRNLKEFTLDGGSMRHLRSQVSKFRRAGTFRTEEYRCGSNPDTDRKIGEIIDQWCGARTMVNPLVYDVKDDILAGTLDVMSRLFLTYHDDVLQNVILITDMSSVEAGYLMDLEFYPPEMRQGGLEYAIVEIIKTLVEEGCTLLSLGGTYGCKLAASPSADQDIDKLLDELREQKIFNDEGNFQFKNKFRPDNTPVYLCRPVGCGNAGSVLDIILMIADPLKNQTIEEEGGVGLPESLRQEPTSNPSESEKQSTIECLGRPKVLADAGFNLLNVPDEFVEFDMKTDSWAQLHTPAIEAQMRHLQNQLQQPANVDEALRQVFPFSHFVLTSTGQAAENIFMRAWQKKGIVLQNLLFPSTTMHLIDKGFNSQELPSPEVFRLDSEELYKGNLDLTALDAIVRQDKDAIAFVCIEVSNNAAGGCPISSLHLRELKSLLTKLSIPLVIDATRILENAQFFIERDAKFADRDLWAVAREILSSADAVIGSLTKDFCVNRGGIIATNDTALFKRVEKLAEEECAGIDVIERKQIALSLASRRQIEKQVLGRMECCRMIWHSLYECGVPVAQPVGGHCILIDVKQITDFAGLAHPVVSFLAWLYLNTGIRGGAHSVGMQQHTAINGMVRLAVPVGLTRIEAESVIGKLVGAFERKVNIPELALESQTPQPFGAVNANYKLIRYHKLDKNTLDEGARICTAVPAVSPRVPGPANFFPSAIAHQVGDIAIVGMAGRYPKAANTRELWRNLVLGMDCVEEIPQSRYELNSQCRFNEKYRGGFIDSVDRFDAQFFKVPENEAEMLDPQERLFLEVAWEALEDGGYYPETLAGDDGARNIGVYVGAVWSMYQMLGFEDSQAVRRIAPNSFHWSIANRVSYWMNLCGPSLTLDTACSSSLTAVCLAVESIRSGECCAAIVGGVNLDLHPAKHEINLAAGILSSDGVCRSFGKGANGYVAGEGVGALLLKPLDKSIRDNDNIYGVIRSAVVNHGGRTAGYTIPNPKAESQLIRSAIEKAGIDARSIGYIEAHGTGTQMGDAIEIAGLEDAFHPYGVDKQSCAIGTVKTNIGHLEAAAGVVGISKVLLQMKHRQLVPSLHANEPNELIDFANSSFYVVQQLSGWEARQVDGILQPLRAGVSCFGAGGTNAHIILDSYERVGRRERAVVKQQELIYPLSARSEEQLRMLALRLADFLEESEVEMRDIAYTLQVGRKSFDHRIAIVASTKEYLREKLMSFASVGDAEGVLKGQAKNERGLTGLLDSKEKEELARILSQRRDPHGLATLWVHGLLADWQARLDQTSARKVSIPTYPFVGKRYWVTREAAAGIAEKVAAGDECESPQGLPATQESQLQFNASDARGGGIAELTSVSLDGKMTLFLKQHAALQLNLQLGEIAADAGYFELGYSSIEIANLLQCLNELLGENLSVGELLGYPDIRSLAAYLTSVYPEKVAAIQVVKTTDVTSSPHSDSHPKSAMVNGVGSELLDKLQWHNAIPNESYEMVTF